MAPWAAAGRKDAGKVTPVALVIQRECMCLCVCVCFWLLYPPGKADWWHQPVVLICLLTTNELIIYGKVEVVGGGGHATATPKLMNMVLASVHVQGEEDRADPPACWWNSEGHKHLWNFAAKQRCSIRSSQTRNSQRRKDGIKKWMYKGMLTVCFKPVTHSVLQGSTLVPNRFEKTLLTYFYP